MKTFFRSLLSLYASNPFIEKERVKAQWRFLKFLFLISSGVLLAYAPDERAFLFWGICFVATLCFSLAIAKNPIIAILGLLFTPFMAAGTIFWWGGKRLIAGLYQVARLKVAFVVNSPRFTSLRALFVSLFFTAIATVLVMRGVPDSPMWSAGLYLTLSLGTLSVLQLMCLCREPLAPLAAAAERSENLLENYFQAMKERSGLIGMLTHMVVVDKWFKKLAAWSEKDSIFDTLKTARTRLFVFFWFILLFVGTVYFTNLFFVLGPTTQPRGLEGYIDLFATLFTAMTGNFYGTLPPGLGLKVLFAALCFFQILSVVLLVLVYSIGVDSDVHRIRRAIAQSAAKSSALIINNFERLLRNKDEPNSIVIDVMPECCQFRTDEKGSWLTFAQVQDKRSKDGLPVPCRVKTAIPIRSHELLAQSEVMFHRECCRSPVFDGKPALQVEPLIYTLPEVGSGFCELEFDSTIPNANELLCSVEMSYAANVQRALAS